MVEPYAIGDYKWYIYITITGCDDHFKQTWCLTCVAIVRWTQTSLTNSLIVFKYSHSRTCTSFIKMYYFVRMKCNMRSTYRCSCVLQFTLRRAFCCGLHRSMSQVIPCLGLGFCVIVKIQINSLYPIIIL